MAEVPLRGTTEGVPVEGIGKLFWAIDHHVIHQMPDKLEGQTFEEWSREFDANVISQAVYDLPDDEGFSLVLELDHPFRDCGWEDVHLECELSDIDRVNPLLSHRAGPETGESENLTFPGWFVTFLRDLQQWTDAREVTCYNEGPEEERRHEDIEIKVLYDSFHEFDGIRIRNYDVFIGSLAVHLERLAKESV